MQVKSEQLVKETGELEALRQQLLQRERELSLKAAEQSSEGATLKARLKIIPATQMATAFATGFAAALLLLPSETLPAMLRITRPALTVWKQQVLLAPSSRHLPALTAGQPCGLVRLASGTAAALPSKPAWLICRPALRRWRLRSRSWRLGAGSWPGSEMR